MTNVTAIGVDDEEYVVPNLTDRLDTDLPSADALAIGIWLLLHFGR